MKTEVRAAAELVRQYLHGSWVNIVALRWAIDVLRKQTLEELSSMNDVWTSTNLIRQFHASPTGYSVEVGNQWSMRGASALDFVDAVDYTLRVYAPAQKDAKFDEESVTLFLAYLFSTLGSKLRLLYGDHSGRGDISLPDPVDIRHVFDGFRLDSLYECEDIGEAVEALESELENVKRRLIGEYLPAFLNGEIDTVSFNSRYVHVKNGGSRCVWVTLSKFGMDVAVQFVVDDLRMIKSVEFKSLGKRKEQQKRKLSSFVDGVAYDFKKELFSASQEDRWWGIEKERGNG